MLKISCSLVEDKHLVEGKNLIKNKNLDESKDNVKATIFVDPVTITL